ncbi:Protein OPI10 [Golovinomyces cichoracearum]|uniref:Protein OPI10 n=1 Tax=Golovinomyces cichoracearum TaxID=62708 RepID=A0A420IZP1_9PEZI|nr:Protein OPI10 [Golovinomyces cichoracearum]
MDAASVIPQLFGIIPTGSPVIITPTTVPSPTSYTYNIPLPPPPGKPFTHLTVFLLPGITLPPLTAAAVYLALPQTPTAFQFLGAIGASKESAVFKVSGLGQGGYASDTGKDISTGSSLGSVAEIDMDAPDEESGSSATFTSPTGEIIVGISIETAESVAVQLATLQATNTAASGLKSQSVIAVKKAQNNTLLLAQRIIRDAFNFLSSYGSGSVGEMVPLKVFEEWWRKFENKIKRDPSFLENSENN